MITGHTSKRFIISTLITLTLVLTGCGWSTESSDENTSSSSSSSSSSTSSSSSSGSVQSPNLSFQIHFPLDNANVGGHESAISVRGLLKTEDDSQLPDLSNVRLSVSGVNANLQEDGVWTAEVPLNAGENSVGISLLVANETKETKTLVVHNSFIPSRSARTSDGQGNFYYVDIEGEAVLKRTAEQEEISTLFTVADFQSLVDCDAIVRLELSRNLKYLLSVCERDEQETTAVFATDLEIQATKLIALNSSLDGSDVIHWVDDKHFIFSESNELVHILEADSSRALQINLTTPDVAYPITSNDIFVDDAILYVPVRDNPMGGYWATFDLSSVISDWQNNRTIQLVYSDLTLNGLTEFEFVTANQGTVYFMENSGSNDISVADLATDSVMNYSLALADGVNWAAGLFHALAIDETAIIVSNVNSDASLYRLNRSDLTVSVLDDPFLSNKPLSVTSMTMAPDGQQLLIYNRSNEELLFLNTESLEISERTEMREALDILQVPLYGEIAYDWENKIVYRRCVSDWIGNHYDNPEPILVSYDLETDEAETLLSAASLFDYFGDVDLRLRMGSPVVMPDADTIWFSLFGVNVSQAPVYSGINDNIYALNLQNLEISPIVESTYADSDELLEQPFLSDFYEALNGVLLTEWSSGYLRLLDRDGTITDLYSPLSPYFVTRNAVYDKNTQTVFFDGTPGVDNENGYTNPEFALIDILELDIATKESHIIASNSIGRGVSLQSMVFELDRERRVLISVLHGNLLIIDTVSGDRVLKPLQ